MPQEYDFLDVYRMDKELDAATKGVGKAEKAAYLKDYFGYRNREGINGIDYSINKESHILKKDNVPEFRELLEHMMVEI